MDTPFEEIMKLNGAEELQALLQKWDTLSENIRMNAPKIPILLPDLLLYTKPGFGNTRLLYLLADYLETRGNLMDFYGDVKVLEFMLNYCKPGENFTELNRLMEEIRTAAGFRSEFRGILRVNINEWLDHQEEKHFLTFMEYLAANSDGWMIVLTLSESPNEKTKDLEALISMYLRIETVTLHLPKSIELMAYVAEILEQYGLSLDESACALLRESIKKLRGNKHFDGLHTIRILCNDIIYNYYSGPSQTGPVLTAADLSAFSAESDYIQRTLVKIKKHHTMGFAE